MRASADVVILNKPYAHLTDIRQDTSGDSINNSPPNRSPKKLTQVSVLEISEQEKENSSKR